MKKLFNIELTDKEFDRLICEQNKGKELKVVNGKVVAIEHQTTEKELLQKELQEIGTWFIEYDNQVRQYSRCQRLNMTFDKDINELDNQAKVNQERIREIRSLLNN